MKRAWSPSAEAKLRKLYASTSLPRLAFLLKRTPCAVKSRAKVLGITRGKARRWTAAEVRVLRARFRDEITADIARDLGRKPFSVFNKAHALGLKKSRELRQAMGRIHAQHPKAVATRIKPGTVPPNKGLRRPGWFAGRMRETQFKKGRPACESSNYRPIGSERICADGYLERKITDDRNIAPVRRWVAVHRLIWIAANGEIPTGHIVVFKRGMHTTVAAEITIDKLELITRVENMHRNTIHNLPAPLPELIQLRGALVAKINRRIRAREKQNARPA